MRCPAKETKHLAKRTLSFSARHTSHLQKAHYKLHCTDVQNVAADVSCVQDRESTAAINPGSAQRLGKWPPSSGGATVATSYPCLKSLRSGCSGLVLSRAFLRHAAGSGGHFATVPSCTRQSTCPAMRVSYKKPAPLL